MGQGSFIMITKEIITAEAEKGNPKVENLKTNDLEIDLGFTCTELGNAERLDHRYGPILRYSWQLNKWLIWNGSFWRFDDGAKIASFAESTVRGIYVEASGASDAGRREELAKHAIASENSHRIEGMIKLARSINHLTEVTFDELDRDPFLFNVSNGTIDLKTGRLKPHDREDLITKLVLINYNPDAECPIWMKFLDETTEGNQDLMDYLQLMFGVCLTGDMLDQVFFYLYGLGQNGKSTLTDKLLEITGDYGMRVDSEMFMLADRGRGGATEAIANIRGKRVIVSSEVPEGRTLNTGLLKDLTGGGELIRARRLYEHEIEFKPTCKITMFGNHKPTIRESTLALWRRLKLIPFKHTVLEKDRDQFLGQRLSTELPGILAWAVRGCLIWQSVRFLTEPEVITSAISEYRSEEDILADFLADKCNVGANQSVSQAELKKAYHKWCEDNTFKPLGPKKFADRLIEKECRKTCIKNVRSWVGLGLQA